MNGLKELVTALLLVSALSVMGNITLFFVICSTSMNLETRIAIVEAVAKQTKND